MDRPLPVPPAGDCPAGLLYAQSSGGTWCRAPIYARLVAEWRDRGRTVPAHPDVPWVPLARVPGGGRP